MVRFFSLYCASSDAPHQRNVILEAVIHIFNISCFLTCWFAVELVAFSWRPLLDKHECAYFWQVRSPPPSAKQQSAAHSADKKEETIVVKVKHTSILEVPTSPEYAFRYVSLPRRSCSKKSFWEFRILTGLGHCIQTSRLRIEHALTVASVKHRTAARRQSMWSYKRKSVSPSFRRRCASCRTINVARMSVSTSDALPTTSPIVARDLSVSSNTEHAESLPEVRRAGQEAGKK